MAIGTVSEWVEAEALFCSVGGGKGNQSFANKVRSHGASNGDNNGRSFLFGSCCLSGEPPGGDG